MFTLSGEVFSVNKISQFALRLVRTSESSAVVRTKSVTLQTPLGGFAITVHFYMISDHQMVHFCWTAAPSLMLLFAFCALVTNPLTLTDVPQLP